MPEVDLSATIQTRKGQPIAEDGAVITVRDIAFLALDTTLPEDGQLGPAGKLRLARAGFLIMAAFGRVELPSETISLILDRAASVVNALIYGQLVQALDPAQLA